MPEARLQSISAAANCEKPASNLSVERLRELLIYDESQNLFRWRKHRGRRYVGGKVAGFQPRNGEWRIKIDDEVYALSHLAHFYCKGEWPSKPTGPLTQARLKELLHYDPETGIFTRKSGFGGRKKGTEAGTLSKGYVNICVDGRGYTAGKLAFLYMTGSLPRSLVDHKDLNRQNNAWENLREATQSQNGWNSPRSKNNTTGFKGVWRKRDKFAAEIMSNRKRVRLGSFATAEEAHAAYCAAANELHGEFARTS